MRIWPDRDGAQGTMTGNVTTAAASWFVNPGSGDLHLRSTASGAIDQAAPLAQVTDDYDGDARPRTWAPTSMARRLPLRPPPLPCRRGTWVYLPLVVRIASAQR